MKADRAQLWRFGAVALFCGLPLLLLALSIGNLAEASAAREIASRQDATASQIVREVAKRQTRHLQPRDTASLYLASPSPSLARAELQERAGHFIQAAGGHLEEAQFTSTPEQEGDGTVAIQLSLTIDNAGLRDLLYAIETATPLLDATDLGAKPVASDSAGMGQAGMGQGGAGASALHVDLTVQGHFKKGTG